MTRGIAIVFVSLLAGTAQAAPGKGDAKAGVVTITDATPDVPVAANLHAAATLYRAAMLDELKMFAAVDAIVEQFVKGTLPLSKQGSEAAYEYLQGEPSKLGAEERRRLYAHVFGTGDVGDAEPNREFAELFARFVESANAYRRQTEVGESSESPGVSAEAVRKAARDLAVDVSNHSYGAPLIAAPLLARKIELAEIIARDAKTKLLGKKAALRVQAVPDVLDWLGDVSNVLATQGGKEAEDLGDALADRRIPSALRTLARTPKPKHQPLTAASAGPPKVVALCFDEALHIVPCKVVSKPEPKKQP